MIEATVAMAAMAGLFVAFGLMRVADRAGSHGCGAPAGCTDSRCGSCPSAGHGACDLDLSARQCELHDTGVSS
jgi:hypothetical protein